jgi:hypothetical protein
MRNPERIKPIMTLLTQIWEQQPDTRFNQLIHNLQAEYASITGKYTQEVFEQDEFHGMITFRPTSKMDLFNVEDDDFQKFLQEKLNKY